MAKQENSMIRNLFLYYFRLFKKGIKQRGLLGVISLVAFSSFSLLSTMLKFIINRSGKEYGIRCLRKLKITMKIIHNYIKVKSLATLQQHFILTEEVFKVPKSLKGEIVECGCYNGSTTVTLSLACALTNRRLVVCDSFEGLPSPRDDEKYEIQADSADYYLWEQGEFNSEGGLQGVKETVKKYGNIELCQFIKGYFKDTLRNLSVDSIVFVFEDADIASSVEDCLRYLWPKLQEGCKFYSHEPWSINVVSLFYDKKWWKENLNMHPPGFYGSGYGIVVSGRYSNIGYAKKFDVEKIKKHGKKILQLGSKGFEE